MRRIGIGLPGSWRVVRGLGNHGWPERPFELPLPRKAIAVLSDTTWCYYADCEALIRPERTSFAEPADSEDLMLRIPHRLRPQ